MKHITHARVAGALVLLAIVVLGRPAFAQADLSGSWTVRTHEDFWHRNAGPEVGDYTGLPLNDEGRLHANTHDASIWSQRGYQCRPHGIFYGLRGPAESIRITRLIDDSDAGTIGPAGRLVAYELLGTFGGSLRKIWMDGRPHPPAFARHTWQGFSTGKWVGNMLVVTTTHIKKGYLQRNGADASDQATVNEYFFRFGEGGQYLNVVTIIHDPLTLEEPFIRTTDFVVNLGLGVNVTPIGRGSCGTAETGDEIAGQSKHHVVHFLPGSNDDQLREVPTKYQIPFEAAQGGARTTYPEYIPRLREQLAAVRAEAARAAAASSTIGQTGIAGKWRLDRPKSTFTETRPARGAGAGAGGGGGGGGRAGGAAPDAQLHWRTMVIEAVGDGIKHTTDTKIGNNDTGFFREEYTAKFDGQDTPIFIKATALDTVALKRIDANTIERVGKIAGKEAETSTWKVSPDGRVLTVTMKGSVPDGPQYSSVQVFNRE